VGQQVSIFDNPGRGERRLISAAELLPSNGKVVFGRLKQPIIVNRLDRFRGVVASEQGNHFEDLSEPNARVKTAQFSERAAQLRERGSVHGNWSPTVGNRLKSRFGFVAITSTAIGRPLASGSTGVGGFEDRPG
jgi:hypothetical protein